MPKYDPFSEPLLSIVTFQEMTIKHLMYMQKVPFLYTERACVVLFVLKFTLKDFVCQKSVASILDQRENNISKEPKKRALCVPPIRMVHPRTPGTLPMCHSSVTQK